MLKMQAADRRSRNPLMGIRCETGHNAVARTQLRLPSVGVTAAMISRAMC